jgi:uncharacterized membrane protein
VSATDTLHKARTEVDHLISMLPAPTVNVGKTERKASLIGGALLTALGLKRLSLPGLLLAFAGGLIAYRGLTGSCGLYERLGIDTNEEHGRRCCQ